MALAPFITFDGLDGGGKSTQCRLLADWLRGRGFEVVTCVDPGGTEVGTALRQVLLDPRQHLALPCEALLFMASRAQLVAEVIRPALAAVRAVVCDRFLLANVVYQGHAGGLDPAMLWTVGQFATGGVEPDLTFVLDLPLARALERRKAEADRLESRSDEYFARVRAGFLTEARRRPDRILVLDATASAETVHAEVVRHLDAWLRAKP